MQLLGRNVTILCATAILSVAVIESVAIMNGMNGAALGSAVAAIIGLPTYIITRLYYKNKAGK